MTKGSVVFARVAMAFVVVGILAIIVGNLQITMGDYQSLFNGYTVRYVGLSICMMTAIVFLFVRMEGQRRQRVHQRVKPSSLPLDLTSVTGPSAVLVTWIRVFCLFLFVLATYNLVISGLELINVVFGRYRFRGMPTGYVLYMLFYAAALLAPGFLIWFMTNVIVRMSVRLDEVSSQVAKLEERVEQMRAGAANKERGISV